MSFVQEKCLAGIHVCYEERWRGSAEVVISRLFYLHRPVQYNIQGLDRPLLVNIVTSSYHNVYIHIHDQINALVI